MSRPTESVAAWLGRRKRAIAARSASGAKLTVKLVDKKLIACVDGAGPRRCGAVPDGATIGLLRKLFRRAL